MGVFDTLPPNRKAGGRSVVITNFAHHCQSTNEETKEVGRRMLSSPCRKPARWLLARRHEGWCTRGKNFKIAAFKMACRSHGLLRMFVLPNVDSALLSVRAQNTSTMADGSTVSAVQILSPRLLDNSTVWLL